MAASAYAVSVPVLAAMSPVIAGLVLTIPIGLLTAGRNDGARLFTTPEDRIPPSVLIRAGQLANETRPQTRRQAALV